MWILFFWIKAKRVFFSAFVEKRRPKSKIPLLANSFVKLNKRIIISDIRLRTIKSKNRYLRNYFFFYENNLKTIYYPFLYNPENFEIKLNVRNAIKNGMVYFGVWVYHKARYVDLFLDGYYNLSFLKRRTWLDAALEYKNSWFR